MVLVAGDACSAVVHRCEEWIERGRDRCRRYSADARCAGTLRPLRFCIDRYEYPNRAGELPVVMKSWLDAEATCKADGKRLCQSAEWTLACEGAERRPYPYGSTRDASACNIDRRYREPDFGAFADPERVGAEVLRLDQRVASGALARCVSPFGVHDLTGNVDEWVVNESGKPDVSGLKGGYWGPIRARCQPMTTAHNRWFRFYQVGFRCCADPGGNAGQH